VILTCQVVRDAITGKSWLVVSDSPEEVRLRDLRYGNIERTMTREQYAERFVRVED
jgi:hypothetical protein